MIIRDVKQRMIVELYFYASAVSTPELRAQVDPPPRNTPKKYAVLKASGAGGPDQVTRKHQQVAGKH